MNKLCVKLFLCFCQILPILSIQIENLECRPSIQTIRNLENQHGVIISKLSHYIHFDYEDNIVITNTAVDITTLYLKKVQINFTGIIDEKQKNDNSVGVNFVAEEISVDRLKRKNVTFHQDNYHCKLVDWNSLPVRLNSTKAELIIEELTKNCIEDSVCKQYEALISHIFLGKEVIQPNVNFDVPNGSNLKARSLKNALIIHNSYDECILLCNALSSELPYNPQSTINSIFDFAVSAVVTIFAGNENGVMQLPYIEKDFQFAGSSGEFKAFDGTFVDLRALYRVKDVLFTNEKDRFMVGTSLRLAKAKLNFPVYNLRYGYIKIDGHLDVDIDGITVSLKLAADYNSSPCQLHLIDLNMDELGTTKVDFTGLGWPLNSAVRRAIRYVIEHKIFEIVKDVAVDKMKEINCEQFRPSLDKFNDTTLDHDNVSIDEA